MPCSVALEPSRKRQEREDPLDRHPSKRPKLYWDSLSKIWLTRDALEELDRRNRASGSTLESSYSSNRPLTRQWQASFKRRYQTLAPDPLIKCKPGSLSEIQRFARRGGPDLSDLRNFPEPHIPCCQSMSASSSRSRSQKRRARSPSEDSVTKATRTTKTTKTTSTTAYNRNFEQKLIDYGVYLDGYEYPNGQLPAIPNNLDEINKRLTQRRPSLSPLNFSESEFRKFKRADINASKEKPVATFVIPTIDGDIGDSKCVGGDYLLGNYAHLTDGTLAYAKPDHFFGARPEQLHPDIRDELNSFIIPSTQSSLPILPNFFLEAKGPDGSPAVATRQACYDGALGARGIHKLQSYREDNPIYDNNAYTITSTYQAGVLKLYTTHPTAPREKGGRPEYIMTSLRSFAMIDSIDTFRSGACAYRNARDWAKEQRDRFINDANERHTLHQSGLLSSEHGATSEPTVTLDDSDTSATSDEAECHDATQWSFAQPDDSVDDPRASSKHAGRARAEPTNSPDPLQN